MGPIADGPKSEPHSKRLGEELNTKTRRLRPLGHSEEAR